MSGRVSVKLEILSHFLLSYLHQTTNSYPFLNCHVSVVSRFATSTSAVIRFLTQPVLSEYYSFTLAKTSRQYLLSKTLDVVVTRILTFLSFSPRIKIIHCRSIFSEIFFLTRCGSLRLFMFYLSLPSCRTACTTSLDTVSIRLFQFPIAAEPFM